MREHGLTALFLCGLVAMALATHVHGRWVEHRWRVSTVTVYLVLLALVAAVGTGVLGPAVVWNGELTGLVLALPVGALIGVLTWHADRKIVRRLVRPVARPVRQGASRARPIGMAAPGRPPRRVNRWRNSDRQAATRLGFGQLAIGAVLEEVVYRGVLVAIAVGETPAWSAPPLLLLSVLAFGLSHLPFGWPQAVAKLPLSVLAMAATLATGTVLAAVIGHLLFNHQVWRRYRRTGGPSTGGAA